MCFITHSSIFQFIALLFYNIVIHVADLLIMCCFCNKYFLLMNICLSFVLFYFQKLSSWIIYKVHVQVHILPNQDWLVPEFSTFSILILICYYWSHDIGINKKGWSVLAALYPPRRNGERVWKHKGHISDLNFKDISLSVKMDDIPKFEKQNDVSINIFGYVKNEIFPVHITNHRFERHINLLMISDNRKNHYCWIKDLNRLLGD